MRDVFIIGVSMTQFGKLPDRSMKSLASEAVEKALKDAGIAKEVLQGAAVANCVWGINGGQECIRGQVVLRSMGIERVPVINVENACASGSTAINVVWSNIALGTYDVGLALGMEKLTTSDLEKALRIYDVGTDIEDIERIRNKIVTNDGIRRAIFMDLYAKEARAHMDKYGTTQKQLAIVSSKNHFHSTMNPYAHYRKPFNIDDVLQAKTVVYPLTQPMCSPMSDGAAAAILCSTNFLKKINNSKPIKILASVLTSGCDRKEDEDGAEEIAIKKAYEIAGLGPKDIDVAEVHDATAFAELSMLEKLGFCSKGEGGPFSEAGHTSLGGKKPVNVSGGLECKGHPVGATGIAMVAEIVWQLRGEAVDRQVTDARVGLIENGGGSVIREEGPMELAAASIHILRR